jgi:Protein of unknown function (DUF4058)
MPSPFPGMDPYLEAPRNWLDFHNDLAAEIRTALNGGLSPRYVAWLTSYATYEVLEIAEVRSIEPDVSVWERPAPREEASTAVATLAPPAPVPSAIPMEVPLRLYRVEVREVASERLVTVIEILSRANKRPGHRAYRDYDRKRDAILRSPAHLLEIDLLRAGERRPLERPVPVAPYYVLLSRAGCRPAVDVWPIHLWEPLPELPVPLLEPDPDAQLDLAAVVRSVYDRGPYRRVIDYREPPPPPSLSEAEAAWVDAYLRERGLRGEGSAAEA